MKGRDFADLLRIANCLSEREFIVMFGQYNYEHYLTKLQNLGLAKFIMYLDGSNVEIFFNHINKKLEEQRVKYGA